MSPDKYEPKMTRAQRSDLARIIRARARVAMTGVKQRSAELLVDVETQLAAIYEIDDAAWADVTRAAEEAVAEADARVAEHCEQMGIPAKFRPGLRIAWFGRGQNAVAQRRAELRKLAVAQIAAQAAKAKAVIEARAVELEGDVLADGLTTEAARTSLASLPTPADLMPLLPIGQLQTEFEAKEASREQRLGYLRGELMSARDRLAGGGQQVDPS
jgi:hypothetical protein